MKNKYNFLILILVLAVMLIACSQKSDKGGKAYHKISMVEVQDYMDEHDNYIILDVRTSEEYNSGHIPGAINVANESISTKEIPELPDKEQLILVYCRSGNRSKKAAEKLVMLGYTSIVEIGGINDWQGEIEK